MQQRGQRHLERMANVSEKVVSHVETMEPSAILDRVDDVEKADRIARRNFGLENNAWGNSGPIQVHVLAQRAYFNPPGNQREP
jgi:hypothetical protein